MPDGYPAILPAWPAWHQSTAMRLQNRSSCTPRSAAHEP